MRSVLIAIFAVQFVLSGCGPHENAKVPSMAAASLVASAPPECSQPNVLQIQRPFVPSHPRGGGQFPYAFQFVVRDTDAPTIVYLPGGPGNRSINDGSDQSKLAWFPKNVNVVFTDPRGVGCNEVIPPDQPVPEGFWSTETLADDVIAVIRELRLQNYVIYGASYGTMLGTVVAEKANTELEAKPRTILMESTLGRWFGGELDPYLGNIREWELTKTTLLKDVLDLLSRSPLPFDLSKDYWGLFLVLYAGSSELPARLAILMSGDEEAKEKLKEEVLLYGDIYYGPDYWKANRHRLYRRIFCEEIARTDDMDMALVDGKLVGPVLPNICDDIPMTRPFDSATFAIGSRIVYFEGAHDPATYREESEYHFINQKGSLRIRIVNPNGAHSQMIDALALCKDRFWEAVLDPRIDLEAVVQTCGSNLAVEMRPAGS